MRNSLCAVCFITCAAICSASQAQDWAIARTSIGQVALDYSRNPVLADQKYRNVEIRVARVAVIGAPAHFPSGRIYLPVLGLGDRPVHAIFPAGEIPSGIGKGTEISMTCTAQGFYTLQGQGTFSPDQGFLTLACAGLRLLDPPVSSRPGPH